MSAGNRPTDWERRQRFACRTDMRRDSCSIPSCPGISLQVNISIGSCGRTRCSLQKLCRARTSRPSCAVSLGSCPAGVPHVAAQSVLRERAPRRTPCASPLLKSMRDSGVICVYGQAGFRRQRVQNVARLEKVGNTVPAPRCVRSASALMRARTAAVVNESCAAGTRASRAVGRAHGKRKRARSSH